MAHNAWAARTAPCLVVVLALSAPAAAFHDDPRSITGEYRGGARLPIFLEHCGVVIPSLEFHCDPLFDAWVPPSDMADQVDVTRWSVTTPSPTYHVWLRDISGLAVTFEVTRSGETIQCVDRCWLDELPAGNTVTFDITPSELLDQRPVPVLPTSGLWSVHF